MSVRAGAAIRVSTEVPAARLTVDNNDAGLVGGVGASTRVGIPCGAAVAEVGSVDAGAWAAGTEDRSAVATEELEYVGDPACPASFAEDAFGRTSACETSLVDTATRGATSGTVATGPTAGAWGCRSAGVMFGILSPADNRSGCGALTGAW